MLYILRVLIVLIFTAHITISANAQQIDVKFAVKNINASGGVTTDAKGNIYVSDFGPALGNPVQNTKVYIVNPKTLEFSVFAEGFAGASGSTFDSKGNFYQSNPFSGNLSRRDKSGSIQYQWSDSTFGTPVGVITDSEDFIYISNCSGGQISKITQEGRVSLYAKHEDFLCPNGLTIDDLGNLYSINFGTGKVFKIDTEQNVSVFAEVRALIGGPNPVGNGHATWKNGFLFVTSIGTGGIYKISREGEVEHIAGALNAFANTEGQGLASGFSKPNGIAASVTGDTLYVNVSDPIWTTNPPGLHPAHLMMITGVCSLEDVVCKEENE